MFSHFPNNYFRNNVANSQNPNWILIAHLNINSLRNKFDIPEETITNKVDIPLISETKLDSSFVLQLHIGLTKIKMVEALCSV